MPRKARKLAESGIYHVMLRGIDRQQIFDDTQDYMYFLQILQQCRVACCFKLYAYCLMGNHVHLLVQVQDDSLETIFKRIGGRYVYWYNVKYQRVGHLFQDRFKSEPVEDDAYFLTVLRYIHQNPVKANICRHIRDYPYSSYSAYLTQDDTVDTAYALGMLSGDEFVRFNEAPNSDKCLEIAQSIRRAVTDDQAREIIKKCAHCQNVAEFQHLEEEKRARMIKKIYGKGVSIRQLSRLTGTSKGMVEKWIK